MRYSAAEKGGSECYWEACSRWKLVARDAPAKEVGIKCGVAPAVVAKSASRCVGCDRTAEMWLTNEK
jgi:hypothetical protein